MLLASGGIETFIEDVTPSVATASPTSINLLLEPVAKAGLAWWWWVLVVIVVVAIIYGVVKTFKK